MNSRERVLMSINHVQPDRTPTDFQAVNDVWIKLAKHFKTGSYDTILEALDIDCRWVNPPYTGPAPTVNSDGSFEGWGGSLLRVVRNQHGSYEEVSKYAVDEAETPEDIDRLLKLPDPDHYDYSVVAEQCRKYDEYCIFAGMASAFYYPTLVRSLENILVDMALYPEMANHLFKRCTDWHLAFHERLLAAGKGRIDALQIADDFSTQTGLLFSIDMFRKYFKKPLKNFVELGKSYGTKIFFHCCGCAYGIIPELIDIGVEILDPIQTTTPNMEPEKLKREFGEKLAFHGAMNTQYTLPLGTPEDVRKEAKEMVRILGKDGGYILTSCHLLQSDVPVENILALYEVEHR